MRSLLLASLLTLALPSIAAARTVAPPGNSGVSQYLENIPTAEGGQPTNMVHPHGGVPGGSGGGGGGISGSAGISASTAHALAQHGPDGRAAIALARATPSPNPSRRNPRHQANAKPHSRYPKLSAISGGRGSSPATSVFHALTGSASSSGGLGVLLPIILIVSVIFAGTLALHRRRAD